MNVDILAIGAHPDDIELGCGGTLAKHVALGHTVGLVDLTRGEMGSRGTVLERDAEAVKAAQILGASFRVNLDMPDGRLVNDFDSQQRIIELVRTHRPALCCAMLRATAIPTTAWLRPWWLRPASGPGCISGNR